MILITEASFNAKMGRQASGPSAIKQPRKTLRLLRRKMPLPLLLD